MKHTSKTLWYFGLTAVILFMNYSISKSQSMPQDIGYQLDASQRRILRIYNLFDGGSECHRLAYEGRVVQRDFAERGILPNGIIIQGNDGTRLFINIDNSRVNFERMSRLDLGWITHGLQTMLNEGRSVVLGVKGCGASGRFLYLDSIISSTDAPTVMPPVGTVPPTLQACRRFPSLC